MNDKINIKQQFNDKNLMNLIFAVVFTIIQAMLSILLAFILKALLEVAGGGNMSELIQLLLICAGYLLFDLIITAAANHFTNCYIQKALLQFKACCFGNYLKKNVTDFQEYDEGTYISSLSNDITSIESHYLNVRINFFMYLFLLIGGSSAMIYLNWKLACCVLISCFLPVMISLVFGNQLAEKEKLVSDANSSFTSLVKNLFGGFSIIKSFQSEKEIQLLFNQKNRELENEKKCRRGLNYLIQLLSILASSIINFIVFGYGAYLAIQGELSAAAVIAFIQLLNYVISPIQQLPILISGYKAGEALISHLQELCDREQAVKQGRLSEFKEGISLEHLTFSYNDGQTVINDVSYTFKKGKRYAIVGTSGSGKSTLIDLMMGYYDTYGGTISYDQLSLSDLNLSSLFEHISFIQQDVFIFDDTLTANVSMYKHFNEDKLMSVIEASGLVHVADEKGIAYRCGENGRNLSGGEKQRVSIARALLRDTPILFVDEATAALDNATARKVEEAILSIKDQTCIYVTHRLQEEILRQFDEILVMHNGEICESGSYEELISKQGVFYSLYMLAAL